MGRCLVVVMALGLAACGSKKDAASDEVAPAPEPNESPLVAGIDAAPAADPGPLHVAAGPCGLTRAVAGDASEPSKTGNGEVGTTADHSTIVGGGGGAPAQPREPKQASGSVRVTTKSVVGALDKDVVERYLRRYAPRLRFCYQRALADGPSFGGKVEAKLVISAEGKVTDVALSGNDRGTMFSCFQSALRSRAFPEPKEGVVMVAAQIALEAGTAGDNSVVVRRQPPKQPKPKPLPVGSYDYEKVSAVWAASEDALRACLAPLHAADPDARGTFGVDLTVSAKGSASAVRVDATFADDAKACLVSAAAALTFPTHELKLAQNVTCYFEYGAISADDAREGAAVIDATGGGASAALVQPDSLVILRANPDTPYSSVYAAASQVRESGARYIALDVRADAGWEPAYTPPIPQARYHGGEIPRDPLHIHITTDAIRVRGAKKIRAKDGKHDFAAVEAAMETLTSKGTYAHRHDVAIQADRNVPYETIVRVVRDAVRHGLTRIELQAPNR